MLKVDIKSYFIHCKNDKIDITIVSITTKSLKYLSYFTIYNVHKHEYYDEHLTLSKLARSKLLNVRT